ncbi:Uncharacterised protein [Legionella pneumophila]|nr:hypothetical protein [Legionella pneumophila subsp. pneumophila]CZG77340.1 Uncharacterised protein [Legionella pneumophila]CZH06816.1 Uncharacterised protein [Legionella pneumophila]CZH08322.1 Uncharacterised protein [Legionella pneumophila]CZH10770.1 Uncharacterised protein [Legionella pneumophila]
MKQVVDINLCKKFHTYYKVGGNSYKNCNYNAKETNLFALISP